MIQVCARLEAMPPELPPGPLHRPDTPPPERPRLTVSSEGVTIDPVLLDAQGRLQPATWRWRYLHPIVWAWFLLLALVLPTRRQPWTLALFALAVRVALTPDRTLLGGDEPYERYVGAMGLDFGDIPSSPTWTAMLGSVWMVVGRPLELPHHVNLVLSVLMVVLVWDLIARWFDPRGATAAAFILACLPLPVAVARSENLFILAAFLQIAAALGVARADLRGLLFAAASIALLAHLHPTQVPMAIVLCAWLMWRSAWWAGSAIAASAIAASATAVATGRLLSWLWQEPDAWRMMDLHRLQDLLEPGAVVGPGGTLSPSDPMVTPIGVTALAIGASLWMPRGYRRFLALAGAGLALATVPYLHLPLPTDIARFQLPAQVWLAVLAGAGWAVLDTRAVRLWLVALVLSWSLARAPLGGKPWTWSAEHDVLSQSLAHVPEDATVRFRPIVAGSPWQQRWLQLHGRGIWKPMENRIQDDPLKADQYRWIGRADAGFSVDACQLEPVHDAVLVVRNASVESVIQDRILVGMYRVIRCEPPGAAQASGSTPAGPPAPDPLQDAPGAEILPQRDGPRDQTPVR